MLDNVVEYEGDVLRTTSLATPFTSWSRSESKSTRSCLMPARFGVNDSSTDTRWPGAMLPLRGRETDTHRHDGLIDITGNLYSGIYIIS